MKETRRRFCYQELDALEAIERHWTGRQLTTARAIYGAMTQLAAEQYREGGRGGFVTDRAKIARKCGSKSATVDVYMGGLVNLGLIRVERRTDDRNMDLPSEYVLLDGSGDSSGDPVVPKGHTGDTEEAQRYASSAPEGAHREAYTRAQEGAVEVRRNASGSPANAGEPEAVRSPANAGERTSRIEGNDGTTPTALKDQRSASERDADPEYVRLADLLADLIAENRDGRRPKGSDVVKWRRPIRLMVERDDLTAGVDAKRARRGEAPSTAGERRSTALKIVEKAIRWCQADQFWSTNVLSGETLRKQYDKLEAAARAERGEGPAQPSGPVVDRTDDRLRAAAA